ncbi:MAG: glycerol kinase GlpK [Dehalococcoidia bacterium]|nr:glycerol kinase GlpK [Dehalococcoidia bacterium]
MAGEAYILALDQGTTGSTALLFDADGGVVSRAYREIRQIYPQPGWVEQSPRELVENSVAVLKEAVEKANVPLEQIKGLGITNQRETTILWERHTGKPVANAIVWQCRRTARMCEDLKTRITTEDIRHKTGLTVDAYFSGTKLRWLLDNIPDGQRRAEQGELCFGTVDSWLIWNLSGGSLHITDYSNASRTMLYNIRTLKWDRDLLACLNIPPAVLPQVVPSSRIYGETVPGMPVEARIPIAGVAGDQQAALFGQACYKRGMGKNTYGTGSFLLFNTGTRPIDSKSGLLSTIAWGLDDRVTYALEGSIFITGAAVQWLRDGLGLIHTAAEVESLARSVPDNGGIYFVPALAGLGAPYWDMYARGTIVGITRGTNRGHMARATLEAIAYQTRDVLEAIRSDAKLKIPVLRVDGGASVNDLLMQFQADISGIPVQRAQVAETTALGACYLAGLATGVWKSKEEISKHWHSSATFEPKMSADERENLYACWKRAVERARGWAVG